MLMTRRRGESKFSKIGDRKCHAKNLNLISRCSLNARVDRLAKNRSIESRPKLIRMRMRANVVMFIATMFSKISNSTCFFSKTTNQRSIIVAKFTSFDKLNVEKWLKGIIRGTAAFWHSFKSFFFLSLFFRPETATK